MRSQRTERRIRSRVGHGAAVLAIGMFMIAAAQSTADALEIGPEDDFCTSVHGMDPGDELVLRPGDYQGPCVIRHGGSAGAPLIIRAADPDDPPRIAYIGVRSNVLEIRADHVTIRGLHFGRTQPGVDAIRVFSRRGVAIESCHFDEIGGVAVAANNSSLHGLTVRGNTIVGSGATAMYFGCHDGVTCELSDVLVERNVIHRAGLRDPEGIGYGLQLKLNASGVVRDNVITGTKGPGIMVYGSQSLGRLTLVERNFVSGSLTSSGIVVAGGPSIIRNNVITASAEAGIALEDYKKRGLLRALVIAHNTVYGNERGGIIAPAEGVRDAVVTNNAVHARGRSSLPPPLPGIVLRGNAECRLWTLCFTNPAARDFSPGALLIGAAIPGTDRWVPQDDYFGARRALPAAIGAIEGQPGPISLEPKLDR